MISPVFEAKLFSSKFWGKLFYAAIKGRKTLAMLSFAAQSDFGGTFLKSCHNFMGQNSKQIKVGRI